VLVEWQRAINLVSRRSLADLWRRHMLDSAQLLALAPGARCWVDLGSGAGFPGLVLAILGAPEVHLIESDGRKCAFLREAARRAGAPVTVHEGRIEAIAPWPADVVVARACAPLPRLLGYALPFVAPQTHCLFLKGQDVEKELTQATIYWKMDVERQKSVSDPAGIILRLKKLSHA
jgi:16S rRNA (guanine527-N7)-methyltransferase